MTRKIYVVFPDTDADPIAAFTVRKDAEDCIDYLDTISADEHFIADLTISETLEDFIGD